MTTTSQHERPTTVQISRAEKRLKIAAFVLIAIGCIDLVRGFMHTFNIQYAAANIAQVDMTSTMAGDFLVVMSGFGISNYLTGILVILIGLRPKELAPLVLAIIPATYLLGIIRMRMTGVESGAAFNGQYMMMVYLALCVITSLYYYIPIWLGKDTKARSDKS